MQLLILTSIAECDVANFNSEHMDVLDDILTECRKACIETFERCRI